MAVRAKCSRNCIWKTTRRSWKPHRENVLKLLAAGVRFNDLRRDRADGVTGVFQTFGGNFRTDGLSFDVDELHVVDAM